MADRLKEFKGIEQEFQLNKKNCTSYYLLSKQWFEKWKLKVGYDCEANPNYVLPKLNDDIGMKPKCVLKYDPIDSHMWNTILKPNLELDKDYILIDQKMHKFFKQQKYIIFIRYYPYEYVIQREVYLNENKEPTIDAYLKQIRFIAIYPTTLNKLRGGRKENLIEGYQYVSPKCTTKQLVQLLERTLKTVQISIQFSTSARFQDKDNVRLYKMPIGYTIAQLTNIMRDKLIDFPNNKDAHFELEEAIFLENDEQFESFADEQILIMDAKQIGYTWIIQNNQFPQEEKCPSCSNYNILNCSCDCKKIIYCSEMCRSRDEYFHQPICEKQDDDDQILLTLIQNPQSKMGLCGLRNLENTCYMNSALQCLSHSFNLNRHFLDNSFKLQINHENALGSKGQFVNKYAYLMKRLWFDSKINYAPYQIKKLIAKIQPNFAGNAQHDAQEFITFVLDILHEDLNRINIKPYIEVPDAGDRDEKLIAQEQWELFNKRNDSIIVENMYGQYKSKLECPKCQKISITFDPFLMVSVSIPQEYKKLIRMELLDPECCWKSREEIYYYDPIMDPKMRDILDEKSQEWYQCEQNDIILTCSSTYQIEEVFVDELVHFLKKKLKNKKLYLRKLTDFEKNIELEYRMQVLVHMQFIQSGGYNWKKDLVPPLYFIYSHFTTYQELHLQLYMHFKEVLKIHPDFKQEWLEQDVELNYEKHILDQFWKLEFKTNQRFNVDCSYCYKSYCLDCPIPFTEKLLGECLEKGDKLIQPELHIIFLKPLKQRVDDIYDDYQKILNPNYTPIQMQKIKGNKEYTLQHCLEYSAQPEQLVQENSWYCNNCQDHVEAFKTLQIYKAPKLLIFHLKRFKDSAYKLFKSKLQTKVIFPVDDFDLSKLVLNHQLPQDNQQEEEQSLHYELYAICNHIGESGAGHYTAFCRIQDKEWHKFDDAYVTREHNDIVTQHAYILFYRRKGIVDDYNLEEALTKNMDQVKHIIETNQKILDDQNDLEKQNQLKPQQQEEVEPIQIPNPIDLKLVDEDSNNTQENDDEYSDENTS